MGKVIALPLPRKIAAVRPEGATAEILFFTGVRYYRMSEDEFVRLAGPAPRRRAKAKTTTKTTTSTKTAAPVRKLRKLA